MGRRYPQRDVKLLWGLAAARCAFPDCRQICVEDATAADPAAVTGYVAHIESHGDRGPRANASLVAAQRDSYDNWILLCGVHHPVVDKQETSYTAQDLRRWKADHERWVQASLREAMPEVSFAELEVVTQAITHSPAEPSVDFALTPPLAKMRRNELTKRVHFEMTIGLGKANEVRQFVEHVAARDATFPERLAAGFLAEYQGLRADGLTGDDLFAAMREFAGRRSTDFKMQAAGLAVLAYLFEKCEVFEK